MKFLLIIALFLIAQISPVYAKSQEPKAPCRLEVDNAHLSSNISKKEGRLAVKVVFRSVCNLDQENVRIKYQIMKTGLDGDHQVTPVTFKRYSFVAANSEIVIQDIFAYCKNTLRTNFYGKASATATVHGEKVLAPEVRSKITVPLNCGT